MDDSTSKDTFEAGVIYVIFTTKSDPSSPKRGSLLWKEEKKDMWTVFDDAMIVVRN